MSKVKFELDLRGLNQLMKSEEMQTILSQYGNEVATRAKSNAMDSRAEFSTNTKTINYIAVTNVRADNRYAILENLKHNTLRKALGG